MAEAEDNNLPSLDDFLVEEDLPSVEDYIEKEEEELEEQTQTIEDADGNTFAEVEDVVPPWPELIRMINDVREEIPDIPEIKYYDNELEKICEIIDELREDIPEVPEVKYYDTEIEAVCEQIDQVRDFISEKINDIPEIKYYDEQVNEIEDKLDFLQTELTNLPEVKYYDEEIKAICEAIDVVRESIPTFPKWVNEVNEVPDFSWIGKTFSVIDDDFVKVNDTIESLRESVRIDLKKLSEDNEVSNFENRIQFGTEVKDLDKKLGEEKDKIWKELRETSLRIWDYHHEFKDDDRKLKKQLKNEYNSLKENLENKLTEFNIDSRKTDELLLNYFNELREEVSSIVIPEVKDYDDDLRYLKADIKDLKSLVRTIKSEQKQLQEGLLNEPPSEKESIGNQVDPLTPMDQKFATLEDLEKHYRLFINRIQTQISTIGGGGAGFIKDLDDVTFDAGVGTDKLLIYNGTKWVGIASTALTGGSVGAAGTWTTDTIGIHTTKNVGVGTTARSDFALYVEGNQYVDGNITVGGTITYNDVKNVDSIGLITARSGIDVLSNGVNVIGVSTFSTGIGTVHIGLGNTTLLVNGDARVTGILTIGTASITLDPDSKQIKGVDEIIIGTATTVSIKQDSGGQIKFENEDGEEASVGIGTTVSINTTGIITAATIKASTAFYPPLYTTSARDAGTFTQGAIIFNTTTSKLEFYNGTSWQSLPGMSLGLTVALDG